tara:strand:+ start:303 stop:500 length:198 start_codon:yes stop_codon:yes gene_type:complete
MALVWTWERELVIATKAKNTRRMSGAPVPSAILNLKGILLKFMVLSLTSNLLPYGALLNYRYRHK